MRKKSHISLGKYLIASTMLGELAQHRKAFLMGCILPDCKPSFLTRRHEFEETYEWLKETICQMTEPWDLTLEEGQAYWRKMGEVLHYVADYFTYPHNSVFTGTLREHCRYENVLKHYLRFYIFSGNVYRKQVELWQFEETEDLFYYLEMKHREYLNGVHNVERDAEFITEVCRQIMAGMYQLLLLRMEEGMQAAA